MVRIETGGNELRALQELVEQTPEAQVLRRALAIIWLLEGESARDVADRLRVSRMTVYNWRSRFDARAGQVLIERLRDAERSGRPAVADDHVDLLLADVIDVDPMSLGYRQTIWTADLLALHLRKQHDIAVSAKTISRALDRLGIAWKRPRHHLALKSKTWRQAKGGSNVASRADSGRSS